MKRRRRRRKDMEGKERGREGGREGGGGGWEEGWSGRWPSSPCRQTHSWPEDESHRDLNGEAAAAVSRFLTSSSLSSVALKQKEERDRERNRNRKRERDLYRLCVRGRERERRKEGRGRDWTEESGVFFRFSQHLETWADLQTLKRKNKNSLDARRNIRNQRKRLDKKTTR